MSPLKRKGAPSSHGTAKSAKVTPDTRPTKRAKSEKQAKEGEKAGKELGKQADAKPANIPIISRLKEEEPLFPRGGGSVLSPLEHKQIQIQAKNDVLFEQKTGAPNKGEKLLKKKKNKKFSSKENHSSARTTGGEDAVKIESLNFKRLVKGSLVLGQVCDINSLDITLALPNNLTGHVPITAVSQALTKRIEAAVATQDHESEAGADMGGDDIDPRSVFQLGEYLRAYVTSTTEDGPMISGKGRKRIELSLLPDQANYGISEGDVVENCTLMAAIASVEDHGFVMDLGIADSALRGFLPRKQVDPHTREERMQPGTVLFCIVTGKSASGKVIQLSQLQSRVGGTANHPSEATTINTFLPGTAVDVLVSEVSKRGIAGKILGHLDVTADLVHSGAGPQGIDLNTKYRAGSHLRARIICTFPAADQPKLGISVLPHVLSLQQKAVEGSGAQKRPLDVLPASSLVESCVVKRVEPDIGLFVDVGVEGVPGFVHISRVKDGKVDALYENSGPFKVGSVHRGRILGYNALDGVFLASFEKHILDQPYLRIEDVPVGEKVDGTIEKLVITEGGVTGLIVQLADGISGLVPEMHLADVRLQHPEKMFREGKKVTARVLSTNPSRHQLRLTLKKTLVNTETPRIKSFEDVSIGLQVLGTIVNIMQNGAIVQFYGDLRGFLPISEMSEAYISDPREHFRVGQVLSVHILQFDPDAKRLIVSCKDPSAFGLEKQMALKKLRLGDIVSGTVTQKTEEDVWVELADSSLKALLPVGHLADRGGKRTQTALRKTQVGQVLPEMVVLEKNEGRRAITLSQKPSLVKASRNGKLLCALEDARVGDLASGFVRNITATSVFVQFGGRLTALLPKSKLPKSVQNEKDFGMHRFQSLEVKIAAVDREHGRMVVAIPSTADDEVKNSLKPTEKAKMAINPLDETIVSVDDIAVGKITKARIVAIKETQLNVELADNIQGRIDVSQIFDAWDEIPAPKQPLQKFHTKQIVRARVLGVHDARNHRFLPISHRSSHSVLELSIKPTDLREDVIPEPLTFEKIEVGSTWLGFVNNIGHSCLWVNLSPNVRGRVSSMEASDDLSRTRDLAESFPIGGALRVRVLAIDPENRRLDLSARSPDATPELTWDTIKADAVVPGRVTKVSDRQIVVKLSESLAGPVHIVDLCDDYDQADPSKYSKNDIGHFCVVEVDKSNKKVRLSSRPSRVLDSSLPVKDREIIRASQIEVGDIVRGFVKNVSDKGLFINLGGDVTAMVKISDLSDRFLKEWKGHFQVDQLVKGRVIAVDPSLGQVQLSLKESVINKDYIPLITVADLKVGQVVTGKVRKVMDFGIFILVDGSANVSGLCHRSEMAEKPVPDATKLYTEGDVVKALVLKVDREKKRVNFGLKPSYFTADEDSDMDVDVEDAGARLLSDSEEDEGADKREGAHTILISGTDNKYAESDSDEGDGDVEMHDPTGNGSLGLDAGGFDWSADALDGLDDGLERGEKSGGGSVRTKRSRREPHIQVDKTGELDAHGPQTGSDYERLLLGQPDSSQLWIAYMAFQMQVSELAKAREIAERAIKTINIREETEKLNVWTAYLNLEVAYGTDENVEDVFKRACELNDDQEVYERLASIYIQSGKHDKAESLFQAMVKKFGAKSPGIWANYAHFLHATVASPDRARALLPRAMQALEPHTHLATTIKFASLEFRSPNGEPERGRTIFEGLLATWPKKLDLWNQLLDLELSLLAADQSKPPGGADSGAADPAAVRDVFERVTKVSGLKPRWAKSWFQRWAQWEEANGDTKSRARVSVRAKEWTAAAEARKKAKENAEAMEG